MGFGKLRILSAARAGSQRGAALVEFTLSIPVLVLLLSMATEFGNVLSQLTWLSQAAYHIASVGGASPASAVEAVMAARREQLIAANAGDRDRARLELGVASPLQDGFLDQRPDRRTVSLKLTGTVFPIAHTSLAVPVSIEVTAPYMLELSQEAGSLASFANPAESYGCALLAGDEHTAATSTAPCRPTCQRALGDAGYSRC